MILRNQILIHVDIIVSFRSKIVIKELAKITYNSKHYFIELLEFNWKQTHIKKPFNEVHCNFGRKGM